MPSILSPEERQRLFQITQGAEPARAPLPQPPAAPQQQGQPAQGWQHAGSPQSPEKPAPQQVQGLQPGPAAPQQQQTPPQAPSGWAHAFAPNQVFDIGGLQVTGEKLVGLAQRGVELSQKEEEIKANIEKLEGAKVLDVALRSIPGFQEFCEGVIRDRRMPEYGGEQAPPQAPSFQQPQQQHATPFQAPTNLDEPSKTMLTEIDRLINSKLNPILNSFQTMERNRKVAEMNSWKQQRYQETQAKIQNEMKGYPVFTQFAEAGKRLISAELAQNPQAPVDAIVAKVAQLLHGNVQQQLEQKIQHVQQTQEFRSGNGSGISPTQGGPKQYNWDDFLKGNIRRAVNERMSQSQFG